MTEPYEFEPTPLTPVVTLKKRNPLDVVLIGAAVVALAGVAFATGRLTAPTAAAANSAANGGQNGAAGNIAGRPRGSFDPNASFAPGPGGFGGAGQGGLGGLGGGVNITGSVVSVSATEIAVQLANGTTVNIPIDTATAYHTQASATSSDVKAGTKVEIQLGTTGRAPSASGAPAPNASGAPNRIGNLGTASTITIIP